jgi:hypothetical protein
VQKPPEEAASNRRGGQLAGQGVPEKQPRMSFGHRACPIGSREERSQNAFLSSSLRRWGAATEALRRLERRRASEVTPAASHLAPPTGKERYFGAFSRGNDISCRDGPALPPLSVIRPRRSAEKPLPRIKGEPGEHSQPAKSSSADDPPDPKQCRLVVAGPTESGDDDFLGFRRGPEWGSTCDGGRLPRTRAGRTLTRRPAL